jgi:SpoVK/Ycf46/Vps4 family AAA+-type ATPase
LDEALDLAQQLETYEEVAVNGAPLYAVTLNETNIDHLKKLWELVGGWRSARLSLNGQAVQPDPLFNLLRCVECRQRSDNPEGYCRGDSWHETTVGTAVQLFPCRKIPVSEGSYYGWYQYGTLTKGNVYVVDKTRLRHEVTQSLKKSLAYFCPALNKRIVDETIDQLPDRIDPAHDAGWVYKQGWVNGRFSIIGVEKKQRTVATAPKAAPAVEMRDAEGGTTTPENETRSIPIVHYSDIGGLDGVIRTLRESIELPIRYPELFERLAVTAHRGCLIWGPPGTGKTTIAKALATECRAHFIAVNGPEIITKWHGDSEANLRAIFREAREHAPSVILFDEIDSLAPNRDRVTQNFESVLVSQFLTCLDGLVDRGQVVVIGTTNRPDSVDPALKRPGRLDLSIEIGVPDEKARLDILKVHTRRMPLTADVDLEELASLTDGFVGADIASLCREAGLMCLRDVIDFTGADLIIRPEDTRRLFVSQRHFLSALKAIAPAGKRP